MYVCVFHDHVHVYSINGILYNSFKSIKKIMTWGSKNDRLQSPSSLQHSIFTTSYHTICVWPSSLALAPPGSKPASIYKSWTHISLYLLICSDRYSSAKHMLFSPSNDRILFNVHVWGASSYIIGTDQVGRKLSVSL